MRADRPLLAESQYINNRVGGDRAQSLGTNLSQVIKEEEEKKNFPLLEKTLWFHSKFCFCLQK